MRGQALMEYVMLLAVVVSLFAVLMKKLSETDAITNLQRPLAEEFARTYRYGHPAVRGQEDGGPVNIPQYSGDDEENNFRVFINPRSPQER